MRMILNKYVLDEVDRYIVNILIKDSRIKYTDLGKMIGISRVAVKERIDNLVKAGIIERFTVNIDWSNVLALD